MRSLMVFTALLLISSSADAANWVASGASGSFGDKCKSNPKAVIDAVPGAGYTVKVKQQFSSLSMDFVLCVQKNGTTSYELWQFTSIGGGSICRTGHRTGVGSSCSNPLP